MRERKKLNAIRSGIVLSIYKNKKLSENHPSNMIPQPQPNFDLIKLHTTVCKMDRQETQEDDDEGNWMDN
ncbi:hypothetical protein ACOSQ4_007719 [Xanthoceras sorbifolium]